MNNSERKAVNTFNFKSDLIDRKQAVEYLGVTPSTLAIWACTKRYNLPFVKIGSLVKYRRSDLEAFIDERSIKINKFQS